MLAQAAKKLGFHTTVLDPTPNGPAAQVADAEIVGDFKNAEAIRELAKQVNVMTFEIESANADALDELLAAGHDINPSPQILALIKDKYLQKKFLEEHTVPVADSIDANSREEILATVERFGYPFLLRARRDAYDGRGNALIEDESQIDSGLEN